MLCLVGQPSVTLSGGNVDSYGPSSFFRTGRGPSCNQHYAASASSTMTEEGATAHHPRAKFTLQELLTLALHSVRLLVSRVRTTELCVRRGMTRVRLATGSCDAWCPMVSTDVDEGNGRACRPWARPLARLSLGAAKMNTPEDGSGTKAACSRLPRAPVPSPAGALNCTDDEDDARASAFPWRGKHGAASVTAGRWQAQRAFRAHAARESRVRLTSASERRGRRPASGTLDRVDKLIDGAVRDGPRQGCPLSH